MAGEEAGAPGGPEKGRETVCSPMMEGAGRAHLYV